MNEKEFAKKDIAKSKLIRLAYARITVLIMLALLCAGLLISVANDMYAFVKPDHSIVLTVDESLSLSQLCTHLSDAHIVNNPFLFRLYVRSKGQTERVESFQGTLTLDANMSYRKLLSALTESAKK